MSHKFCMRALMLVGLIGCIVALTHDQLRSQTTYKGNGTLPGSRPPIFLNNNASLYTFQNPNFGMPGQLPYAFVAVAHEDCRLFNNGAKLMPKHRLIAAECIQGQNNGMTPTPINPGSGQVGFCWDPTRYGRPVFQINVPIPPGGVSTAVCIDIRTVPPPPIGGVINGYNVGRPGQPYPGYAYSGSTNYDSYQPSSSQSSLTTGGASSDSQSRSFRGFSLPQENDPLHFLMSVGLAPLNRFGGGFGVKEYGCSGCSDRDYAANSERSPNQDSEAENK